MERKLKSIYNKLYSYFGPQRWWPADSAFEVMAGAILTQNTSWLNVEKAIANLKKHKLLDPFKLYNLADKKLAALIRRAGYYNIKAKRLKEFLKFYINNYGADVKKISAKNLGVLRKELLSVKGVGPETADSILLYALNKPVFVIDSYTKRVFSRHKLLKEDSGYDEAQELFMSNLGRNAKLFNEYHALIVALAKAYCSKSNPKCSVCPLDFC
ncbi:MAG: endonuclease III domain-containing protein [Candidatus Omnitrophota bacterium]